MVSKASKAHGSSDSNLHKEGKKKKIIKLHLLEVPNRRETERINKLLNFWNSWVSALPNRWGKKKVPQRKKLSDFLGPQNWFTPERTDSCFSLVGCFVIPTMQPSFPNTTQISNSWYNLYCNFKCKYLRFSNSSP